MLYADPNSGRYHQLAAAEEHFRAALSVLDPQQDPRLWGRTHRQYGLCLSRRSDAASIRNAIEHYRQAETTLAPSLDISEWADLQMDAAQALIRLEAIGDGGSAELDAATVRCERVLNQVERGTMPNAWARAQFTLGVAAREKKTLRRSNLRRALQAFDHALTVYRPETHPEAYRMTIRQRERALDLIREIDGQASQAGSPV